MNIDFIKRRLKQKVCAVENLLWRGGQPVPTSGGDWNACAVVLDGLHHVEIDVSAPLRVGGKAKNGTDLQRDFYVLAPSRQAAINNEPDFTADRRVQRCGTRVRQCHFACGGNDAVV